MIDFTSGANPLGPSNKAKNSMRVRVRNISVVDNQYLGRLKTYIATKEGIEEACISFGCGSTAILNAILETVKQGRILIPHPVSQRHKNILSRQSFEVSLVSLKADEDFQVGTDEFCNAMEGCNGAILPNPHDTTGSVASPDDIVRISQEAERRGVQLVVDETYGEYTCPESVAAQIVHSGKTVLLRTFSIFHALGGVRLGYSISSPHVARLIESRLDPSWINSFAPWAALTSMKDRGYHKRTLLFIENEKAYIGKTLSRLPGVKCWVSPSNILVIRLDKDHGVLSVLLKKYHIGIESFPDDNGSGCIRLPVQTHRKNAYLLRFIRRIMEA